MLQLNCPRCGRVVTEDDPTCGDCGFETGSLHWRLTRTAKQRYMPAETEFRSLYSRLGGDELLGRAIDRFYERIVADDRIKHFFTGVNSERLRAKQKDFLSYALGGPMTYRSEKLREAHRNLGLTDEHFDAVVGHLRDTLVEATLPKDLIEEVVAIAEATREDVLGS